MVKQALLRDVAEILDLHAQVAARLNAKPQFTAAMRDEHAHLAALVTADFITATPWAHLKDLPRYLKGILKRLEKLPAAEQRDARGMAGVLTLQNKVSGAARAGEGRGACGAGRLPLATGGAAHIALCPGTENPVPGIGEAARQTVGRACQTAPELSTFST